MNKDFKYSQEVRYCPICEKNELFVSITDMPHLSCCDWCGVVCKTDKLRKPEEITFD